jgi:lipopolysaccharide biosynthesis protein
MTANILSNGAEVTSAKAGTYPRPAALARLIAYYLPQFHPIPENDEWWGPGFTEWTNVVKANPMFRGHYQPRLPADLGYYDLRVPEVRAAQAELARSAGIEGFCYYHYWFAGRRLLERPFNEVLQRGEPDFPFCLCWANESWSGVWHGAPDRILMEQNYPGAADEKAHFNYLLQAFADERHITVDGKPLFLIYQPHKIPEPRRVTDHWRRLAQEAGLKGLFLVGVSNNTWDPQADGFDGATLRSLNNAVTHLGWFPPKLVRIKRRLLGQPLRIYDYAEAANHFCMAEGKKEDVFPCMTSNWDNTPRCGRQGTVLLDATPERFGHHARMLIEQVQHKPAEKRVVFIRAWNEWAEGNYLEPDMKYGHGLLHALKEAVTRPLTVSTA